VLFVTGTQLAGALFSYGLIAFAGYTTVFEFYRGVRARMRKGENPLAALLKLVDRNRRRYGGYLIHLGVVVIGFGIIGSTVYQQQTQETLTPGGRLTLGNRTMVYKDVFQAIAEDGRQMVIADVAVYEGDRYVGDIRPRRDIFFGSSAEPMTIAGQYSTLESDFYVLLTNWEGDRVTFKVFLNPLINLVWWGGIILIMGTLVAAWPSREAAPVEALAPVAAPRPQPA